MSKKNSKGPSHPKEFFALGSKGRESDKPTTNVLTKKPSISSFTSVKSDGGNTIIVKKQRIAGSSGTLTLGRPLEGDHRVSPTTQMYLYEDIAIDVDSHELLESIMDASTSDYERVEGLICGAIRQIKMNRTRLDASIYLTLIYLAKTKPQLYHSDIIIEAICSLLKRDVATNLKIKGNSTVQIFACNLFLSAFQHITSWPESLLKAYLDDCLGERLWVDRPDCRCFVENMMTAFNTKLGSINVFNIELFNKTDTHSATGGSSPNHSSAAAQDEEMNSASSLSSGDSAMQKRLSDADLDGYVVPRYAQHQQQTSIETYVLEVIRDQLSRRMPLDGGSRNLVRTMTVVCTYAEVRTLAAHRLEMWLTSPKLTRSAQDLLMAVCLNCNPQKQQQDIDLLNLLSRIRLKTKNLTTHYVLCIKELLGVNNENLPVLLAQMITNELSPVRNPNNLTFISVIFHQASDISAKLLAEAFLDCLSSRDDYLRQLRQLLREIVRCVKQDFNFSLFVFSLLQDRSSKMREADAAIKEKYIYGIVDVVCLSVLLSCNSSVREAALVLIKSELKTAPELEMIRNFQKQVMFMMRDAVWWLETIAIKLCPAKTIDYLHCLRKVLFLESPEHYFKIDGWPAETDRGMLLKLSAEMPLMGDTLQRILHMAASRELSLKPADMLDLVEAIVKRAAALHTDDAHFPVLKIHNLDIIDSLLALSIYRHPENTVLPKAYQPPALAITSLYWKSWSILLIISAFNPTTIGLTIWTSYPTLKCLIEMVVTNNFSFPPPTMSFDEITAENIRAKERQISEFCKQQTLEFECHLASSTITEANSRLVHLVVRFEPTGFLLRPPVELIEKLKQLNNSLRLGMLLCQCREPVDFLLSIIQQQGTSESMPWLIDLIELNDSSLDILPVQCLCEFLLHRVGSQDISSQKSQKHEQLIVRLQTLICSSTDDPKTLELIGQALTYFFKKLIIPKASVRKQATLALSLLLATKQDGSEDIRESVSQLKDYRWLLQGLVCLQHFETFKKQICSHIRATWQIETDSRAISASTIFIYEQTNNFELSQLDEITLDLATMIVERCIMLNHILPQEGTTNSPLSNLVLTAMIGIFSNYVSKVQHLKNETIVWENTQDQIRVQWANGRSAQMNIIAVHAMTIILSYGPPQGDSDFDALLDIWFPISELAPTAYLVDTMEEALIFPDWLKLRMIRSSVLRLVDSALLDLEPQQLILFVQSFGIPVASMTRLLNLLDACMQMDAYSVEKQIVDKTYMSQLVDVQRQRGATGGERFYAMLVSDTFVDQDIPMTNISLKSAEMPEVKIKVEYNKEKISDLLQDMFLNPKGQPVCEQFQIFKELQKMTIKTSLHTDMILAFDELLSSSQLNMKLFLDSTFAISLLNAVSTVEKDKFLNVATKILNLIKPLEYDGPLIKFLNSWLKKNKLVIGSNTTSINSVKSIVDDTKTIVEQQIFKSKEKIIELFCEQSFKQDGSKYSLSLIVHQSHFEELKNVIALLLNEHNAVQRFDATKVLDFLKACLDLPRLWMGRDQHEQKNYVKEDVFGFSEAQVLIVLQFILKELNAKSEINNQDLTLENESSNIEEIEGLIDQRLEFFFSCCGNKQQHKLSAFQFLIDECRKQKTSQVVLKIVNRMYLSLPSLMKYDISQPFISYTDISASQLDIITHCLIDHLTNTYEGKFKDKHLKDRMQICTIMLNKMASKHPNILLRQLPMLVALLHGRLHYSNSEMERQQIKELFVYVLSLVQTLEPQIFNRLSSHSFQEIISIYIQLFKRQSSDRDEIYYQMLTSFSQLLVSFLKCDVDYAVNSLKDHENTFRELSLRYPNISSIKEIISFLALPVGHHQLEMNSSPIALNLQPLEMITPNVLELRKCFKSGGLSSINKALNEIENQSTKKPELLKHFVTNIKELMVHGDASTSNTVFKLLMRLVKFNSKYAREFVSSYKECLLNRNEIIQKNALENLRNFIILAIEYCEDLLLIVFNIAVKDNIDVTKYICDTVKLLNADLFLEKK